MFCKLQRDLYSPLPSGSNFMPSLNSYSLLSIILYLRCYPHLIHSPACCQGDLIKWKPGPMLETVNSVKGINLLSLTRPPVFKPLPALPGSLPSIPTACSSSQPSTHGPCTRGPPVLEGSWPYPCLSPYLLPITWSPFRSKAHLSSGRKLLTTLTPLFIPETSSNIIFYSSTNKLKAS